MMDILSQQPQGDKGSKNINNARQESPVSDSLCDDQISGMGEGNLDDTDVDFDTCNSSLCETDNAASPELSEQDILICSPYHQDISISPKLSEDLQRERLLDITEDHPKSVGDIQRDRLLEVVEDTIHRVEYIPVQVKSTLSEKVVNKQSHSSEPQSGENTICEPECIRVQVNAVEHGKCVNNYQQYQDTELQKVTRENSVNQSGGVILQNGVCNSNGVVDYKSANDVTEVNDANLSAVQHSTEVELERPHIEYIDSKAGDAVVSKCDEIILDSQVCVSKMECTLSRANSSVEVTEADSKSVNERPKKAPSSSWDPVLLLQHLYKLDQDSFYQRTPQNDEKHCGILNILPLGTFSEIGGNYYAVLERNYFYCFQSSEAEEPVFHIPLQYATVELLDKQILMLDNRQGRCVHFKFESEGYLDEWRTALESHCIPLLSSEYVEPVHYPLKCHKDVIIVDLGSCSTRAGILMDQPTLPQIYFPTVCASDKNTNQQLYGLEALLPGVRQNSVMSFPARTSAKVTKFTMDIDALKGLFEKIFHDLGVDPSAFTLEICIPRALSTQTQAALLKLLLEDLKVKSVSLTRQALLTLYAHNTSTGIVVDIGDRMDILPVVDGFILETGVSRLPYGGQRIIHHLKHALAQKHISLSNEVESYLVQYIFENLCYIAQDYEKELQYAACFPESVRKSIPLHPFFQGDNVLSNVSLDTGRFQVSEGLFNPDLWGLDSPGLHKLVHQAIQSSGVDVRRHITESIYVSGGVTLLPGFVERLEAEISKLTLPRLKPQIHASPYRNHMAYLGACKLASSDAFPQVCVTSKEWSDLGPRCLKKWHL